MTHQAAPAFAHSSGPRTAAIAIVGDFWGEQEQLVGRPFQGYHGQELTRLLSEAGIARRDCFLTNVLAILPPGNDIASLCGKKAEVGEGYALPHLGKTGQYLRPEYLSELNRLAEELQTVNPCIVIALGSAACWALLGTNGIGAVRGTVATGPLVPGLKVLPTYHPAAVLRQWAHRPIVVADLLKAKRESQSRTIDRPARRILVSPTLAEIAEWIAQHFGPNTRTACDIETKGGFVEMVGFSAGPSDALVVPFYDAPNRRNYWPTFEAEKEARGLVANLLANPSIQKVFQNGMYDMQYLFREGFRFHNVAHDTMLLHHALFPEMQKGLGFLGSIYTNEPAWKLMRGRHVTEMKKDD